MVALTSNTTNNHNQIHFSGKSSFSVRLIGSQHVNAFPKWLASERAHPYLLGTSDISQISEGLYRSVLPSISWFGIDIVPTFFQKISVHENQDDESLQVKISIQDSEVNFLGNGTMIKSNTFGSRLVQKVMGKCSFTGGNDMSCLRYNLDGTDHLELSSELTLRLVLPLTSRLMILPPGFNSIGNRIFQNEAEKRVKDSLLNLVEEYNLYILES
jgi:hypothetical protein